MTRIGPLTPQHALQRSAWPARLVVKLVFAGAAAAALVLLVWPLLRGDRHLVSLLREAALPAGLLVLVLLVALRHERRWAASVRAMSRLLEEIRAGEAASEDLASLGEGAGHLSELAERISTLCRDLRAREQAVRELEAEIQRRVATRTDTLQRKLGAMREQASSDALTGLGNRRAFDEILPVALERARIEGADLCVVMIDVDYFKQLNDRFGHAAGDDYLRQLGRLLRGALRERDGAFRYGGDEFVLLLWNTGAAAGRATARRVERLADDLASHYLLPTRPRLSCGIATLHQAPGAGVDDLLRRADEELYRLKHARKSQRLAA